MRRKKTRIVTINMHRFRTLIYGTTTWRYTWLPQREAIIYSWLELAAFAITSGLTQ